LGLPLHGDERLGGEGINLRLIERRVGSHGKIAPGQQEKQERQWEKG
jgi:hypothetical protein